jgi:single-strand DNA-binding protein
MVSINRVMIAGHLTQTPDLRNVGEKSLAQFCLAINHRYKGKDGETKEDVTFVDVEAWGKTAELAAQYLEKGSSCFVDGRLKLEVWEDKNGGGRRSKMKVAADNITFLNSKSKSADGDRGPSQDAPAAKPARRDVVSPSSTEANDEPPF